MYLVVTAMTGGRPVDQAACASVRDEYGLMIPVLYDKDNVLNGQLGMRVNAGKLVVSRGNVIEANAPLAMSSIESTIDAVLASSKAQ